MPSLSAMRHNMKAVAARISAYAAMVGSTVKVGTSFDPDYLPKFISTYPAIWVVATHMNSMDKGKNYTTLLRQELGIQVMVRTVVQRLPDPTLGITDDVETRLDAVNSIVNGALFGWTPQTGNEPFVFVSAQDMPNYEPICACEIIFISPTTYAKGS